MLLVNAALSAMLNVIVLGGIPFLFYYIYHRRRHERRFREIAQRAGLRKCENRYIWYSLLFSIVTVAAIVFFPPPLEQFTRSGSPQSQFVGLSLSGQTLSMAFLYGFVKTGFSEEFLFRGLIAGSLSRKFSEIRANLVQTSIFLIPHLFILITMPAMWWLLVPIFAGSLFFGWVRIKSGSILGPVLIHAIANFTVCMSVAVRTR